MKLATSLGAILIFASSAVLACDYPDRPHIPDGSEASKEELLAARNEVHVFFEGVDQYLRCIEDAARAEIESGDASDEERQKRDEDLNKAFDAANVEKEMVGELLNKQIRAWNAKRKQDSAE
jgi:hypothetical protein